MVTRCECNCGAVAFEILSPLSDIYVCHCSICRRFTGGASIPVIVIPNDRFKWLKGQAIDLVVPVEYRLLDS